MSVLKKIERYYKSLSLLFFNFCVILLLLNIAIMLGFKIIDHYFPIAKDPVSRKYGINKLKQVYSEFDDEAIRRLLKETWSRPYMPEPFTGFKERSYKGKYVNVDKNGFRVTKNQGPWPPNPDDFNIFLFGGSTTFGYGVPDEQTIASYLQLFISNSMKRNIYVYNFGRGDYISTQERILFGTLMVSGYIPDMAIFIDGFNDFIYPMKPHSAHPFQRSITDKKVYLDLLRQLPMTMVARAIYYKLNNILAKSTSVKQEQTTIKADKYNKKYIITATVDRYLRNKRLIEGEAAVYNIQTLFVWQPIPIYKYDLKYHLFFDEDEYREELGYLRYGYEYMANLIEEKVLGSNFLWCADIQEQMQEPLYVDQVHYSANMNKIFAFTIDKLLIERNLR